MLMAVGHGSRKELLPRCWRNATFPELCQRQVTSSSPARCSACALIWACRSLSFSSHQAPQTATAHHPVPALETCLKAVAVLVRRAVQARTFRLVAPTLTMHEAGRHSNMQSFHAPGMHACGHTLPAEIKPLQWKASCMCKRAPPHKQTKDSAADTRPGPGASPYLMRGLEKAISDIVTSAPKDMHSRRNGMLPPCMSTLGTQSVAGCMGYKGVTEVHRSGIQGIRKWRAGLRQSGSAPWSGAPG